MKKIFKGITILAIYIAVAITIALIIDFGWEISTKILMPNSISISVGALITAYIIHKTTDLIFRTVEGNDVLLTVDTLFPKKLPEGQTKYNCYYSGFNIVWWWEKDSTTVDLEADIADKFKIKASTLDDDIFITVQYDVEPDPNDLSVYVLNGTDEKDREKNIKLRVESSIKRYVETFASCYNSSEVVKDSDEKGNRIVSGEDGLQKYLEQILEAESESLGIVIKKVRVAEVDFSEQVSKARNDKKAIEKTTEAVEATAKRLNISNDQAFMNVLINEGKVKKTINKIEVDESLLPLLQHLSSLFGKKNSE